MIYQDSVYGKTEIKEQIALDLIKSPELKRLKGINQIGYGDLYYELSGLSDFAFDPLKHNRFEHSVGVYVLLKNFGAPLSEQIAGLIHDISHSCFSHCIDFVLGSKESQKTQSHQDNLMPEFIENSEVAKILKKNKIDLDYILDDQNFPLKETSLPDLCADRIDYSLRDAFFYEVADKNQINYFLENLQTKNNQWVFKTFKSAKEFAQIFFHMNQLYYSSLPTAVMFKTVGDYLKHALLKKYIKKADLYKTDQQVLKKINPYLNQDEKLKLLNDRMNNKIKFTNNFEKDDNPLFCKSRVVDPLYEDRGEIKRLSDTDKKWEALVMGNTKPKEYFIKFAK